MTIAFYFSKTFYKAQFHIQVQVWFFCNRKAGRLIKYIKTELAIVNSSSGRKYRGVVDLKEQMAGNREPPLKMLEVYHTKR